MTKGRIRFRNIITILKLVEYKLQNFKVSSGGKIFMLSFCAKKSKRMKMYSRRNTILGLCIYQIGEENFYRSYKTGKYVMRVIQNKCRR